MHIIVVSQHLTQSEVGIKTEQGEESQGATKFSSAKVGNLLFLGLITPSIPLLQSHVICETLPRTIF